MVRIFILVVAGIRIVLSVIFGFRSILRIAVPDEVTVPLEGGGAIVAQLVRKGWGWGGFSAVGGTVKLRAPIPSHFLVSAFEIRTTTASPDAIFTISRKELVLVWFGSGAVQHMATMDRGGSQAVPGCE